ncbi:MAG: hypothetical protein LBL66_11120 [Clostridiales bacterium]|jgi:hypothetical protein|nr:hypothetical protein [Clostridiales bacterium]
MTGKKILRLSAFLLCLIASVGVLSGCRGNDGGDKAGDGGERPKEEIPVSAGELERDYAYMWHKDGLNAGGEQTRIALQTERYALFVDYRTGKLVKAGLYDSSERYDEADESSLDSVDMDFKLRTDDSWLTAAAFPWHARMIHSGRNVNTLDYVEIRYPGQGDNRIGRVEYTSLKMHFAISYELFSKVEDVADLAYTIAIEGYSGTPVLNGRGMKYADGAGDGFVFIKDANDSAIEFSFDGGALTVEKSAVSMPARSHKGFAVIAVPIKGGSMSGVDEYLATETLQMTAGIVGGAGLTPRFNSKTGVWEINVNNVSVGDQKTENGRKGMERVLFSILGGTDTRVVIGFMKDTSAFSVTGFSPMLRDADTLEPTGEQVQISKNWHSHSNNPSDFNYAPNDSPRRKCEGVWYHGFAAIEVSAGDVAEREYTCVYGNWGETYAASHAQLCLIGWGGDQLWDESALGSWGESVTYDPDIGQNRSMIDDVRPFLVSMSEQYGWSGNVGGADFLNYIDAETGENKIINQKVTYRTQAPNVTNVNYSGVTADKKISAGITINMGRTNDVVRTYYTLKYTFNDDVRLGKLSLFKLAADGYADNGYTKYAYGDADGILERDKAAAVDIGYPAGSSVQDARAEQFWFGLYNSTVGEEGGDVMFTVRKFNASIGGQTYGKPGYRFAGTNNNGYRQQSCELTVPSAAGGVVPKGSTVEMTVEYAIVPGVADKYYGKADYLLDLKNSGDMGTADALFQQAAKGKITVAASKGTVKNGVGPVIVSADGASGSVAEFTVTGGLGYVPVLIDGLASYKNWQLQVRDGDEWADVNQSLSGVGTDYYQAYRDAGSGKYQLGFNVPNCAASSLGSSRTYRLIKK